MTDYLYAGPIDASYSPRVVPSNRISYHCDACGQITDAGICERCEPERHARVMRAEPAWKRAA